MSDLDKYRHLNQDSWKRTQVRMPQDLYSELSNYAKENNLSLNSAMLALCEKGLDNTKTDKPSSILEQGVLSYYIETQSMLKEMKEAIDRLENKKPTT